MSGGGEGAATAGLTARGASGIGLASVVAAGSSYLVLVIAARHLSTAQNADFLVFWSLLFLQFGVLLGVYQESTRAVAESGGEGPGPRVLTAGLRTGVVVAAVVVVTGLLWAPRVLGDRWPILLVLLAAGGVAFAGHCGLAGALGGLRRWTAYAGMLTAEALLRLGVAVVAAVAAWGLVGFEAAAVAGAVAWLAFLPTSVGRAGARATADVDARTLTRHTVQAMVAAAASAALVVGYPVLLRATSGTAEWALAAPTVLAISLTRAPLLMVLAAYQGAIVSHVVATSPGRPVVRIGAGVVAVGVLGAVAAFLVGPWIMTSLFGPDYALSGAFLAGLTLAATLLALLTLTGSALLAVRRHRDYVGGWLLATAVSVLALLLPLPLGDRALLSLVLGPLAGLVWHATAIRSAT